MQDANLNILTVVIALLPWSGTCLPDSDAREMPNSATKFVVTVQICQSFTYNIISQASYCLVTIACTHDVHCLFACLHFIILLFCMPGMPAFCHCCLEYLLFFTCLRSSYHGFTMNTVSFTPWPGKHSCSAGQPRHEKTGHLPAQRVARSALGRCETQCASPGVFHIESNPLPLHPGGSKQVVGYSRAAFQSALHHD